MRAAAISLTLGFLLLVSAGETQALGFGRVVNVSTLGQPLNFAAAVRLEPGESLVRECVSAEVQAGDVKLPAAAVRLTLEPGADSAERQVRITTLTPIDEPVATVTITAGCVPSLSRSFVTLIDPPLVNLAQAGGTPPPTLPPQRIESPSAPAVAVAQAASAQEAPAPRPAREPAATRPRAPRPALAPAPRAATVDVDAPRPRRAAVAPARVAPPARTPGPRLRLEQVAPIVTAAASAPGDTTAAAESAASAAAVAAAAAASAASAAEAEQRRITALEQNLAALRESTAATQKALAELQGRLKESETARYANPLVYALAVLAAFLSVVVALLWWRQSHARGGSQWWLAPAAGPATGTGALRAGTPRRTSIDLTSGSAKLETEPAVMDDRANRAIIEDMPPRVSPPAAIVAPPPVPTRPSTVPPPDPPVLRRELSVEELIDLEQQADFFVVLGQDEAAIDLLMGHVRSSGGISPLPYLKLLEIYRRRGEREAYERVRERFNRRFNAYAPDWDADLQQGKSLDDYPKVLVRLQRYWDEPSRITALLDESLMRHGDAGENFELPAYRELLFLYSIARDLAEHPAAATGVDLLLPLEGEAHETPIERLSASRFMGFAPTLAPDPGPPHVDLDVTRPAPVDGAPPSDFLGLVGKRDKDKG
jgi:pilus assembly protein FimV